MNQYAVGPITDYVTNLWWVINSEHVNINTYSLNRDRQQTVLSTFIFKNVKVKFPVD